VLTDRLLPLLQKRFPNRGLRLGIPPHACAVFPAVHPEVGDVEIYDDGDELTLVAGNFTHSHFSKYNFDGEYSDDLKEKEIVEEVATFLNDLFSDRVVLWGSHQGGGGWYYPHHGNTDQRHQNEYVWSGPRPNSGLPTAAVDQRSITCG
jgi:hypothetical protein